LPVLDREPALKLSDILKTTQLHAYYSLVSYKTAGYLPCVVRCRTGPDCRFWNLRWFKNTKQSLMQMPHRCFYAFLTCNRTSCLTHDVTRHHHWHVSSWVMWLRMLLATTSLPKHRFAFFIFHSAFLLNDHKNLPEDHCSSICNTLMMITGVPEAFAICRLYRFHWPWFSL